MNCCVREAVDSGDPAPKLEELAALMKQQAEKRFAPVVQTAPAPENETDNRAFCI